ncbi:MAG: hypothetical protein WBQ43_12400 [Terriglobales bacterium]
MTTLFTALTPPQRSIVLQTRLGNNVDNIQPWHYSHFEWAQLDAEPKKWEPFGAVRVNNICPVYNCHGLTFASRRTEVASEQAIIKMILDDDGFEEVKDERDAKIGNVIVYWGSSGIPEHSGIVVGDREGAALKTLMIWSKWGKGYEVVHPIHACLWGSMTRRFYRINKWKYREVFKQNS